MAVIGLMSCHIVVTDWAAAEATTVGSMFEARSTIASNSTFLFFNEHAQKLEADVYFAHPYSSWELGA